MEWTKEDVVSLIGVLIYYAIVVVCIGGLILVSILAVVDIFAGRSKVFFDILNSLGLTKYWCSIDVFNILCNDERTEHNLWPKK